MSAQSPGSWSLTKTDAEMCIAETRTIPSVMPASARQASTSSVMSMISCRLAVSEDPVGGVGAHGGAVEGGRPMGAASMLPRILPPARPYGAPVKQVGFRARLFLILLGFALIPTIVLAAAWELTVVRALPLLGTTPAMERIAETGARRSRRCGRRR